MQGLYTLRRAALKRSGAERIEQWPRATAAPTSCGGAALARRPALPGHLRLAHALLNFPLDALPRFGQAPLLAAPALIVESFRDCQKL
jgi:hypothetical protein